ncbi:MAG TPA: sugar phosphate isomerase/epimerase [Bryobacteraceae bacterium]|jgi:sugar phosphate isomerase/epimerase
MPQPSRRTFIASSAGLLSASTLAFGRDALRDANLGVELYTVRNIITKNPAEVLKAIQQIGYKEVEAVYASLGDIGAALKDSGLKPVSVHLDTALFMEGGSKLDDAYAKVKQFGFEYAVLPYIPPAQRGGIDTFKKLADILNKSGEKAKAAGLKLCYHNHAFEFEPLHGTTGFEILMHDTHKNLASLELDIFWASVAGHDPVALVKKYGDRIALLHIKDKKSGFPVQYNEKVPPDTFREAGNGSIDIPAVLAAAKKSAVRHYFVEQDQTPGSPIDSLRQSYRWLSEHFSS